MENVPPRRIRPADSAGVSPAGNGSSFKLLEEVEAAAPLGRSDRRNLPRAAVFLGGYCRFAAVTAEASAASRRSWRRSLPLRGGHGGGLFYTDTKTTQRNASHATSAFFITGAWLRFAPLLRGTCTARRKFRRNRRGKKQNKPKKATSTGRGRWSCGGLRRASTAAKLASTHFTQRFLG